MTFMRDNWRSVLAHFEEVAPHDAQKAVLVRAAEDLTAGEYFEFLKTVRDLYISGDIRFQVLEDALMPSRYKEGFLPLNYQNGEVRSFVESVKPLVPPAHALTSYPDDILSGKASAWVTEQFRSEDRRMDRSLLLDGSAAGNEASTRAVEPVKTQLRPENASTSVAETPPAPALGASAGPEHGPTRSPWIIGGIVAIVAFAAWRLRGVLKRDP